ncbi:N-acetyl-gamma-glutamyl-phosphate reductase [Oscillibacter sp. MSJ-2]|uniref:N-acetyl-gamma-glutamyl-phosphate reductase n=1 Tax=Dysosmobacter acutus TaxID=2841504 RepID=A0ABS6F8P1_9FIRM|nr:N-acetyl-gamma-glutamyl-phosphate reductase [Dysosmobacter acutus]MBU5626641.1 N-acetyl-gamma-glutamyl-phosphate reductase [Dysosmobacter acutus]
MAKVFIDGRAGTTGLRIYERLASRGDIELLTLSEEERKDISCRARMLNSCDVAFLCLPDAASVEAVGLIENEDVVVLDTSTAHRTSPGWAYGFPELGGSFARGVEKGRRIAVPGCHASGFIALVQPLVEAGVIPADARLSCHSITGYSGGGKKMIAQYEADGRDALLDAPRQYGLTQQHKHLKEMQAVAGLDAAPIFCPIVSDFYSGMVVTVPLFARDLTAGKTAADVRACYQAKYAGPVVRYCPAADEEGFLSAGGLTGKDSMQITVCGNDERMTLIARYDNLGKGASGAAVECLNLVLGTDPTCGLEL